MLKGENNELKFRLQAMEQESKLKDGMYFFFCSLYVLVSCNQP